MTAPAGFCVQRRNDLRMSLRAEIVPCAMPVHSASEDTDPPREQPPVRLGTCAGCRNLSPAGPPTLILGEFQ